MKSALKKIKPISTQTRESVPATTLERAELDDAFDRDKKVSLVEWNLTNLIKGPEYEINVTRPTQAASRWSNLGLAALQIVSDPALALEPSKSATSMVSRISIGEKPKKRGTQISFGD